MTALLEKLNWVSHKQDYLAVPKWRWLAVLQPLLELSSNFFATTMLSLARQEMREAARRERELTRPFDPPNQKDLNWVHLPNRSLLSTIEQAVSAWHNSRV
jgi:hypothetical protein